MSANCTEAMHPKMNGLINGDHQLGVSKEYYDGDIVISGISGRFPECDTVEEFAAKLFAGVDMVTADDRRWPLGIYGLPFRQGKLNDLSKFDANFFGVHGKQADVMDPQMRLLLEVTFESLVDAGVNPTEMRGSNTGVFIGNSNSESYGLWYNDLNNINSYVLPGSAEAMYANRVSFSFDFKGPSLSLDTACSSSMTAFHQAMLAIRNGDCDSAIVGGINITLNPAESCAFLKLNMLNPNGICNAFEAQGEGFVRSEAIVTVFLQKAPEARRIYSYVLNTGTNSDGNKVEGVMYPSGFMQGKLAERVFKEIGIEPNKIDYIEAHGTGTKVGDPEEVNSIAEIFCNGRTTPLLMGSVKSNVGHTETASGLCSVAKVLIAMENNVIPGNIHYNTPNPTIPSISDGRIQVVDKNTKWNGGLVSINSFGFGGTNVHTILKSNSKPKAPPLPSSIPKLVCVSGRTEEAVEFALNYIEENKSDDDFISLVNSVYKKNIIGHNFRGYTILGKNPSREISEELNKKEIWYVFTGMGAQWPGMGKALMCFKPFATAIKRCAAALTPFGIDLIDLIYNGTEENLSNIINCFLSITATQVALVDLLTAIGIKPDGIVGHSAGEMGCAYADGCLTAEQTVLVAYWRGKCVVDCELILGKMAAVGLSLEEAEAILPDSIYIACHNSQDSITISGPENDVDIFIKSLQSKGVFAKAVQSSRIAFHSKYIEAAGPQLLENLKQVIPLPKQRSPKWISSSVADCDKSSEWASYSGAAYHVNNLLSQVLFHSASRKIPERATVIEIAPHSLLQSILKKSLPKSCFNIGLANKYIQNEVEHFISSIGKVYIAGNNPNLEFFHKSHFPVGKGTPMLSNLIKWDHSHTWGVPYYVKVMRSPRERKFEVDLSSDEYSYISGHTIDGRVLFPATGYMELIWKTFANIIDKSAENVAVTFKNVSFVRATIMPKEGKVKFLVNIFDGSGDFEITEGGSTVFTGQIALSEGVDNEGIPISNFTETQMTEGKYLNLQKHEIYRDFRLKGYEYKGLFQGVKSSNNWGTKGTLEWNNNWVSFMDTLLQFSLLGSNSRELFLPTRILNVIIDPGKHQKMLAGSDEISVDASKDIGVIRSGGVEVRGLQCSSATKRPRVQADPKLEHYCFIPYLSNKDVPWEDAFTVMLHLTLENSGGHKLKINEVYTDQITKQTLLAPEIIKILESEPMTMVDITVTTPNPQLYADVFESLNINLQKGNLNVESVGNDFDLIVSKNLLSDKNQMENALASLKNGGFILTLEESQPKLEMKDNTFEVISNLTTNRGFLVFLRKVESWKMPEIIDLDDSNLNWLETVQCSIKSSQESGKKFLLIANAVDSGILGLFNCMKKEPGGENFRCIFVIGQKSGFNVLNHMKQLRKDLLVNVYKEGEWGSMRHLTFNISDSLVNVNHAVVTTTVKGDLSSLGWHEGHLYHTRSALNRELCSVYYAPLNFRDVMIATGKLSKEILPGNQAEMENIYGLEYAGRDSKGRRVMGMGLSSLATSVVMDPEFVWPIPDNWSMEEASTVPIVYTTSYWAMIMRGKMKRGESILIHAGSGGVGLASINIALNMGCEVFTTVGSLKKKEFLLKHFPQLKSENIGSSRDTTFEHMIMTRTNGRGVDLVLNSLSGELLQASVRCLRSSGRFLEIGKFDLMKNSLLGLNIFLKNITFHGIILDTAFLEDADISEKLALANLLTEGLANGEVKPLPTTIFSHTQLEQAFRYMASGKHIGKVVIKVRSEKENDLTNFRLPALRKTYMIPDKSYIIIGGLGGFGLELTNWLINRGAMQIVLVSKRGVTTGYQSLCLRRWADKHKNITISTEDTTTIKGANRLLEETNKLAPVGGIFNLAVILKDSYIENQSKEDFQLVCKAKVDITKNLDLASRKLCPELDYFVVFSSVSCGRGNPGQANYGYANSIMERICEMRRSACLPGIAIQWGAVGDVGIVIDSMNGNNETIIGGTHPQRISSCLSTLDKFLQTPYPVVSSMVIAKRMGKAKQSTSIVHIIGNILGLKDVDKVQDASSLTDLGLDSLMGTEIQQTLEREMELVLTQTEIRLLTFGRLRELENSRNIITDKTENNYKEKSAQLNLDIDKLMPNEIIVKMKSSLKQTNRPPLFFFHPIEGMVSCLNKVANSTTFEDIWGVQCTADVPLNSLRDMVAFYIKEMKKIQPIGPYRLVGYSFGATLAFETAVQLETIHREEVSIVFIDGSPLCVALHATNFSQIRNTQNEDTEIVVYFISLFKLKADLSKISEEFDLLESLESKLKLCTAILAPKLNCPEKEIHQAIQSFYSRIILANAYKATGEFKGPVTLIQASDNFVNLDLTQDITKVCTQKLSVFTVDGNHRTILEGQSAVQIAKIISKC